MNVEPEPTAFTSTAPDATPSGHAVGITVDVQGLALVILATIAVVFALEWAQSFLIPLLLGILLAYTLNPLVVWLERIRIHRVAGTCLVILAVVGALGFGTYSLRGQMQTIVEQLPEAANQLAAGLVKLGEGQFNAMQKVQTAASQLEQAAGQATGIPATPKKPATRVVIDDPSAFKMGNALWAGSRGAVGYMGQAVMVLFLVFFLLLSGDTYKRKLVRLTGPSLSSKKITVQILGDINHSIQRYMFMLLITNVLVALLTWIAFRWINLDNAGAWAVAAGLLHIIPYLGPGLTATATGMVAFIQFGSFATALLVAGASLVIALFVGTLVTTWMTGRIARMNSVAVFVSLLFWGWLWGVWGMLLSIPIIVIVKVVSEHVEQLQPVAELLGE
ncbi:MAG: AI-2E family transporter [Candidatus Competibacteraceae bacterium]|nr:MAG: AI-2E family transporter [Candidatus Competibacteraceae bacterium]